ncbi:recombinase family protein [Brachybacterium alimentarium]|uniref:recombinase family protein n=1 Tax=Brachybacterium alimentarium TaxID=47845 RepID=UPI000DF48B6A|nr:recombinase family protein [Brachybacterium alimentarium]RCS86653.1 recombinase family protein [Brachybacterium alimentarium]
MKFGYTRVSTTMQAREGTSLESQKARLIDAGVQEAHIFTDEGVSGAKASRPALEKLLDRLRDGDEVIVPSLSRLGRNLTDLMNLVSRLRSYGVEVAFLSEGFDTRTATGRAMLGIFGALAEMEREQIAERTALGRERARALGRLGGRPKKYDARTLEKVRRMEGTDDLTVRERASALGIPVASYYVLRKHLQEQDAAA